MAVVVPLAHPQTVGGGYTPGGTYHFSKSPEVFMVGMEKLTQATEQAAAEVLFATCMGTSCSLRSQARREWMSNELPLGRGELCIETEKLPNTFK